MIKNFLYKSLLTLLMDKRARIKLADINTPTTKNDNEGEGKEKKREQKDTSGVSRNKDQNSEESGNRASSVSGLKKQKSKAEERVKLIENALAIYRSKKYIIDQLPKEQREKLMFMALKMFAKNRDK